MSITNSLYIGISGLAAHGDAISVVGDNIANASTVGFKRARASFSDLLGGELGAQRLGGGVRLGPSQTMWEQGSITPTGNPMDVAISGGGMFVVKGNHAGRPGQFYTRDGRFQLDDKGFVVNQQGLRLQGYTIDAKGNRGVSPGDLALGGRQSPPVASALATMSLNLDSSAPVPPPFDPANPQATSTYATSINVTDSTGASRHVDLYFRNSGGSPASWEVHAMADGGDISGGTKGTPVELGAGTLTFDTDGKLVDQNVSITASFTGATPGQTIALDFGDDLASGGTGLGGTTSFASASTVSAADVDGHRSGSLTDIKINDDGTIEGIFDNGERRALAKIAIADFASYEGLERAGDGLVSATTASGAALIDAAGTGGRGSLVSGALEASNVDLGTELVTLIAYQRAFQANAKTVTTADEMMNDINNLKR
ncbi:MAG: flagellar hook protein FlgE [Deltaproteobacteria bacterium]|nr:flagellar hook protein FlgE [Deltaproteobacteria bacterium]